MATPLTWDSDDANLTWDAPEISWDGDVPEGNKVMQEDNRVSAVLSAQDFADVLAAYETIRTKAPFLISISQLDRKRMAKMGAKSVGFVEKCLAYMDTNPEFIPGFVSKAEVDKDKALYDQLLEIDAESRTLADAVGDTKLVVGGELWMQALAFYQAVREAARRKVAGAEVIYADLQVRFPGAPPPPETPVNP